MWVKALNGNVIEVDDAFVAGLVEQGHRAFATEAEARGEAKRPAKRQPSK